jgi:hypothetical protein
MKPNLKNQQSIIVIICMNGTIKLLNIVLPNSSEMMTMGRILTRHRLLQKSATFRQIESATTRATSCYRRHYLKQKSRR